MGHTMVSLKDTVGDAYSYEGRYRRTRRLGNYRLLFVNYFDLIVLVLFIYLAFPPSPSDNSNKL